MQIIPVQPIASQTLTVQLAEQTCQIDVYQKSTGLFLNLAVGGVLIIGGVICENLNRIVRSLYLGFIGDLTFIDTQGSDDPVFTGLGSRFLLAYLEASDLPPGEG